MKCNRRTWACLPSYNLNTVFIKTSVCYLTKQSKRFTRTGQKQTFPHQSGKKIMSFCTGAFSSRSNNWRKHFVLSSFPNLFFGLFVFSNLVTLVLWSKSANMLRPCLLVLKSDHTHSLAYGHVGLDTVHWRHISQLKLQYGFELTWIWVIPPFKSNTPKESSAHKETK